MADVELLPLPELPRKVEGYNSDYWEAGQIEEYAADYARACVEANIAPLQAENERLRAEVERLRRLVQERDTMLGKRLCAGTNADGKPRCLVLAEERALAGRLAEALRELVEVFSESGMYDEEVFAKARAALAKENIND